jgi:hypothetical protein
MITMYKWKHGLHYYKYLKVKYVFVPNKDKMSNQSKKLCNKSCRFKAYNSASSIVKFLQAFFFVMKNVSTSPVPPSFYCAGKLIDFN